ncbi:hypothetical protein FQA39_LY09698 [Lamprigera yunnana]|nr:hypothetical protein FQA39_LY09698 [Lamprigera yunnana]
MDFSKFNCKELKSELRQCGLTSTVAKKAVPISMRLRKRQLNKKNFRLINEISNLKAKIKSLQFQFIKMYKYSSIKEKTISPKCNIKKESRSISKLKSSNLPNLHKHNIICAEKGYDVNKPVRVNNKIDQIIVSDNKLCATSTNKKKILILANNHDLNLATLLTDKASVNYEVQCVFKPNASFNEVVRETPNLTRTFTKNDYVVIL